MRIKRKWFLIGSGALIVVGGAVAAIIIVTNQKKDDEQGDFSQMFQEGMVTASGTTSIGMEMETLDMDYLTESLYVEEVFVSSGDSVSEGDRIFKISDESVAAAVKELTDAKKDADIASRSGAITYQEDLINAKYDYDISILEGQQAKEVYDDTLKELADTLQKSKDEVADGTV